MEPKDQSVSKRNSVWQSTAMPLIASMPLCPPHHPSKGGPWRAQSHVHSGFYLTLCFKRSFGPGLGYAESLSVTEPSGPLPMLASFASRVREFWW